MNDTEELLARLAANDERSVQAVLAREPEIASTLDRGTRALVQLSALIAVDAGTTSLRWAVDVACCTGVDDDALLQVLLTSASAAGAAQKATSAPRLALALDFDLEVDGWDGT